MPESSVAPETQELEFTMPPVPLREGEQNFQAGMNLENARRRESLITDLQKQLRDLGQDSASSEIVARSRVGRAERERQRIIRSKLRELDLSGSCLPATVINLNPVALDLTGELLSFSIPAAGKGLLIKFPFRGRTFTGSYMTISTPKVYLVTKGTSLDPTGDRPTFEARHIPPIGIAHQFYLHYCSGAASGQRMGGLLTFEGNIHTLDKPQLIKAGRKLKVPRGQWIPDLPGEVEYVNYEMPIDEYLARELEQQRVYAEIVIAQGHGYATSQSEDERKQLSNRHVTWHNYALECGYIKKPYPWASSPLEKGPLVQVVFCPDCRTQQEDPEQYFCRNCNSPFDAHKAFMAGKQVSPDRLAVYEEASQEWKDILGEMTRRKNRLLLLNEQFESAGKKRKGQPES
jgi:hypothetical protein